MRNRILKIIEIIIETLQEMLPVLTKKEAGIKDLITYVADRKGHDRRYAHCRTRSRRRLAGVRTMFKDSVSDRQSNGILTMKTTGWNM